MGVIYSATNVLNGKKYIGRTFKTLEFRKKQHEACALDGSSLVFHRALREYGIENFVWDIVVEDVDINDLDFCEIAVIRNLNTIVPNGYNMTPGGFSHTAEIIQKIREAHLGRKFTEEHKEKIRLANLGRKLSAESREKIRRANLGRIFSPEARQKIRLANLGRKMSREGGNRIAEANKKRIRKPLTEEQKKRISEGCRGKKKKKRTSENGGFFF